MRHNGAVYDILDFLGLQLFQHPSNPAITVAQVRLALSRFQVCPDDRRFVAIYDSAQRQFIAGPPALTSATGIKRVAGGWNLFGSSSQGRQEKEEATATLLFQLFLRQRLYEWQVRLFSQGPGCCGQSGHHCQVERKRLGGESLQAVTCSRGLRGKADFFLAGSAPNTFR
jgi:hypothetical protein